MTQFRLFYQVPSKWAAHPSFVFGVRSGVGPIFISFLSPFSPSLTHSPHLPFISLSFLSLPRGIDTKGIARLCVSMSKPTIQPTRRPAYFTTIFFVLLPPFFPMGNCFSPFLMSFLFLGGRGRRGGGGGGEAPFLEHFFSTLMGGGRREEIKEMLKTPPKKVEREKENRRTDKYSGFRGLVPKTGREKLGNFHGGCRIHFPLPYYFYFSALTCGFRFPIFSIPSP